MTRDEYLRLLVELEAFRTVPLVSAKELRDELEACGTRVHIDLLQRFEQLGWERSFAHIRYPKVLDKVVPVEGDPTRAHIRPLRDDEEWDGQTQERYVYPRWREDDMSGWLAEDYMSPPNTRQPVEWTVFNGEGGRECGAPYYSRFQLYNLVETIRSTTFHDNAVFMPTGLTDDDFEWWAKDRTGWSRIQHKALEARSEFNLGAAEICQTIASRYYFLTQGDARSYKTSFDTHFWDWHQYCRDWSAASVLEQLAMPADEVKRLQERLRFVSRRDPIGEWYDLFQFIPIDRKDKLKGEVQYFQLIYSMEYMLRLFYRDLTGEELQPARPHPEWAVFDTVEKQRHGDPKYLRFVANRYRVNPQSKLVVYVEGKGEVRVIPQIAEGRFGTSLEHYGVAIRNLGSVSDFVGKKRVEKKYGALRRLIEELHDLQIITFVLIDNEDTRVLDVRENLCTTRSSYRPERTITRRELVFVWDKSVEFDNFDDEEIASALTKASEARYEFSEEEVAVARSSFGKKNGGDPLSKLYKEKLDYGLNKPELLEMLFRNLPPDHEPRPLEMIVDKLLDFAALNHQPTMAVTEQLNQRSGMLGHPVEELESDPMLEKVRNSVEEGFEPLRELQELLSADAD